MKMYRKFNFQIAEHKLYYLLLCCFIQERMIATRRRPSASGSIYRQNNKKILGDIWVARPRLARLIKCMPSYSDGQVDASSQDNVRKAQ